MFLEMILSTPATVDVCQISRQMEYSSGRMRRCGSALLWTLQRERDGVDWTSITAVHQAYNYSKSRLDFYFLHERDEVRALIVVVHILYVWVPKDGHC